MKYILFILFAITCSCQDKTSQVTIIQNASYNLDSLVYYYDSYKREPTFKTQTKYVKYFPKNFNEFYNTFGWNEKEDKPSPLYETSYDYIDMYFKIISENKKYDETLKLCINGFWQADGVNFLQSNMLLLMENDTKELLRSLKNYNYNEQKSIWKFLLDAPYKKNNLNNLFQKIKVFDKASYSLAYNIWDKEMVYEKSAISTIIIDSLITDINNDKIDDKILIKANRNESNVFGDKYFKNIDEYRRTLCILVSKKKDNYNQINNKKFIPCLRCNEPMDAYSDFQLENSKAFSVKISRKADEIIYKVSFSWNKDNFFLTKIESSNFYDNKIKSYKISDKIDIKQFDYEKIPDYINNIRTIQDPDGFTNLRKDKSTSSEILQKIKSGEHIEILDNSEDWFLVKTKEEKEGYVHRSRIKN